MNYFNDSFYSAGAQRMSIYWDDPWARAWFVSNSRAVRAVAHRARRNPFVYHINHGPDAVQTGRDVDVDLDVPEHKLMRIAHAAGGREAVAWLFE